MSIPVGAFPIRSDVDVAAVTGNPKAFVKRVESHYGDIWKDDGGRLFANLHFTADVAAFVNPASRKAIAGVAEVECEFMAKLRAAGEADGGTG